MTIFKGVESGCQSKWFNFNPHPDYEIGLSLFWYIIAARILSLLYLHSPSTALFSVRFAIFSCASNFSLWRLLVLWLLFLQIWNRNRAQVAFPNFWLEFPHFRAQVPPLSGCFPFLPLPPPASLPLCFIAIFFCVSFFFVTQWKIANKFW